MDRKGSRIAEKAKLTSGLCNMPMTSDQPNTDLQNASKMDIVVTAIEALDLQMKILDQAGLVMVSAHLNEAIERLRVERVALSKKLNI